MKPKLNHFHIYFGVIFLATALVLWMWPQEQNASIVEKRITQVRVAKVIQAHETKTVRFSGVTRSSHRARLAFTVPGRLRNRPVDVGNHVEKGQELAVLDASEYQNRQQMARATVAELRVRLAQAERDRQRVAQLAKVKAATREELEKVTAMANALRSSLAAAEAQLKEAGRVLAETVIRAPFSGTVTAVYLEPGEYSGPGRPILELSGDGRMELSVEVPEHTVSRLHPGAGVQVALPFRDGKQIGGRIRSVARAAVGPGRLFPVVVDLDSDPDLVAGMTAELVVVIDQGNSLSVPVDAVLNPGSSQPYLFCVRDGRVRKVNVQLGVLDGKQVFVRGELHPGDRVVISGHTMISDGDPV